MSLDVEYLFFNGFQSFLNQWLFNSCDFGVLMRGGELKSLLICSLVSSLFATKEEAPSNICREVSSSCYCLIWLWRVFVVAPGILSCSRQYLF